MSLFRAVSPFALAALAIRPGQVPSRSRGLRSFASGSQQLLSALLCGLLLVSLPVQRGTAQQSDPKDAAAKDAAAKDAAEKDAAGKDAAGKDAAGKDAAAKDAAEKDAAEKDAAGKDAAAKAPEPGAAKEQPSEPQGSAKVALITVKGALVESAGAPGLFGELEANLQNLQTRLQQAVRDDSLKAVWLHIRDLDLGRGKLHELREQIAAVRQSGKRVVAEIHSATAGEYLVASACDTIVMPESGSLMIPGVRAEITFYKGLFDRLGIRADMMQVGDFKGTAEPYTRDEMSPQFRKQYRGLLDDIYDQLVETIAADRQLAEKDVRELVDTGLFTARAAKAAGLIDQVAYPYQARARLKQSLQVDQLELLEDYSKRQVDTDFSGMLGMIKLLELVTGGSAQARASKQKKVAVVYVTGTITTGKGGVSLLGDSSAGSDTIVAALRKAADDKSVVGIVLRVDSPGGSALASDLIWSEIRRIDKPVIASMGDVAASGGYYVAMACDKIFAEPGTITGSIGVVGGKISLGGAMNTLGVRTEVISRGKNSGILSSVESFSRSERKVWMRMMKETYRQFVEKTAAARGLKKAELETLAGGRVWTGRQAAAHRLVDQIGTLADAVAAVKVAAKLDADEKVELWLLPQSQNLFDQLLGGSGVALPSATLARQLPGVAAHLRDLQQLQDLFAEPSLMWMPYRVELR